MLTFFYLRELLRGFDMRFPVLFAVLFLCFSGILKAEDHDCLYYLNPGSVKVAWTAFKTTAKIPVGGNFNAIEISGNKTGKTIEEMLNSLEAKVNLASLNTNNEGRDKTLQEWFFSKLVHGISGKIVSVNEATKTASLLLEINGIKKEVPLTYRDENSNYIAEAKIDILDFGAEGPLNDLNIACKELHKGADGISKTWSEVHFKISANILQSCK